MPINASAPQVTADLLPGGSVVLNDRRAFIKEAESAESSMPWAEYGGSAASDDEVTAFLARGADIVRVGTQKS